MIKFKGKNIIDILIIKIYQKSLCMVDGSFIIFLSLNVK